MVKRIIRKKFACSAYRAGTNLEPNVNEIDLTSLFPSVQMMNKIKIVVLVIL